MCKNSQTSQMKIDGFDDDGFNDRGLNRGRGHRNGTRFNERGSDVKYTLKYANQMTLNKNARQKIYDKFK